MPFNYAQDVYQKKPAGILDKRQIISGVSIIHGEANVASFNGTGGSRGTLTLSGGKKKALKSI